MHFQKHCLCFITQFFTDLHLCSAPCLTIIKISPGNLTAKHFFQAQSLCCQLQRIHICNLGPPSLIFNRHHLIQTAPSCQGNSLIAAVKFYNITLSADSQFSGLYGHRPADDTVAPFFHCRSIMRLQMHQFSFHGSYIFLPLQFNIGQRPLSPAKRKMLYTGKLEKILLFIQDHTPLVSHKADLPDESHNQQTIPACPSFP